MPEGEACGDELSGYRLDRLRNACLRLEKMRTSPDVTTMIRLIVLFVAALIRMSPGGGGIA